MGVDTLDKFKKAVVEAKKTWKKDEKIYKEVYMHAFNVNREIGKNNLDTETACIIWGMFLGESCNFLDKWTKFLESDESINVIKKD